MTGIGFRRASLRWFAFICIFLALTAPNADPTLTQALKARAKELERLGLAKRMSQARQVKVMDKMLGLVKGVGPDR